MPGRKRTRASSEIDRSFRRIAADRIRGARALALEALAAMDRAAGVRSRLSERELRALLGGISARLRTAQPAMGPFLRWSAECAEMARAPPRTSVRRRWRSWLRENRAMLGREPERLDREVARRLPARARLLTISSSDSVRSGVASLRGDRRPREVVFLESRPGGEGRGAAAALRSSGVACRVVPDAARRSACAQADLVVVGADAVDVDGAVIHKVGTLLLARVAAAQRRPFVVVGGRSKWVPRRIRSGSLPARFDRTPRRLVSAYWTDRGAVPGGRSRGMDGVRRRV